MTEVVKLTRGASKRSNRLGTIAINEADGPYGAPERVCQGRRTHHGQAFFRGAVSPVRSQATRENGRDARPDGPEPAAPQRCRIISARPTKI